MSIRALAREIGVSASHLSRVLRERDYQTPSGDLARRVVLAFDLPDAKVRDGLYVRFTRRKTT